LEKEEVKIDKQDEGGSTEDAVVEDLEENLTTEPFREETPVGRMLKMDPRLISNLPDEERQRIRQEHPEMNEYFCMSARDKSKFFHLLNQKYRQEIKLAEPPGSAPMKKTIHFKKRF
jgi:hypothetical protein